MDTIGLLLSVLLKMKFGFNFEKVGSKMSFNLGSGAMRQNILHVCKTSFILMHLVLFIILINLTPSVKIIYDALKTIGFQLLLS
jgi:hypothetical protein